MPTERRKGAAVPRGDNPGLRFSEVRRDRRSTAAAATSDLRFQAFEHRREMPRASDVAPALSGRWVQLGPTAIPNGQTKSRARVLVTGRVTTIVVDPTDSNVLYVGAAFGGVWKSIDGGVSWRPTSDHERTLAIGALAMDPSDPRILYAGTGEGNFSFDSYNGCGVLRSTDGGTSWTLHARRALTGGRFSRIVVAPRPSGRVFAATNQGLYRATDGGTVWARLAAGLPKDGVATDVCVHPSAPAIVYAAYWNEGIFRTTDASAARPRWRRLAGGLPESGFTRVALAIAPSAPETLYALFAGPDPDNEIDRFMRSADGGETWERVPLPRGSLGGQGFYNLNVAVDPCTPDLVYLSAVSLWKGARDAASGAWSFANIGRAIHADHHALAFDPADHLRIYAGTDGGIYASSDGGATWSDSINEGLCITQFEFIDDHPTSDAVVVGGTQDNGTEQYRNSPVFHHADDGDGGYCAIDPNRPHVVLGTYYGAYPKVSFRGGEFDTWYSTRRGIKGASLFYPPLTLNERDTRAVAIGTDRLNLDPEHGTGRWPTKVALPASKGLVSAIHYVDSDLLYAGNEVGQVFRADRVDGVWRARAIHTDDLPGEYVWEIRAMPGDRDTVLVAMAGFRIPHVWRGEVPPRRGRATWRHVSGTGRGRLPDIPVNALVVDPTAVDTIFAGTDIGVFVSADGGATWARFGEGLPNCAVFDLRLHGSSRLLRAATHGRGLWERSIDAATPEVKLLLRNTVMDTGRDTNASAGVAAAFADPLRHLELGDRLWWWQCADIKVDTIEGANPAYQLPVAKVDYVAFESALADRGTTAGAVNRVYVQVHNRGYRPAAGVVVKLLEASATAALPPLPADFWTAFPGDTVDRSGWRPIGAAKVLATLSPTEPAVLEWDWPTATTASEASCLLAIVDCADDSIPAAHKLFDVAELVRTERRVGLRSLHPVAVAPGARLSLPVDFAACDEGNHEISFEPAQAPEGWRARLLFPLRSRILASATDGTGVSVRPAPEAVAREIATSLPAEARRLDVERTIVVDALAKGATISVGRTPARGLRGVLAVEVPKRARRPVAFTILQRAGGRVIGGATFVVTLGGGSGGGRRRRGAARQ